MKDDPWFFVWPSCQDLKGKILLKAKKIGGLEESFNGMVEDSLNGEISDEDDVAEIDDDNLHRESVRRRLKVGQVVKWAVVHLSPRQPILHSLMNQPDKDPESSMSIIFRLTM